MSECANRVNFQDVCTSTICLNDDDDIVSVSKLVTCVITADIYERARGIRLYCTAIHTRNRENRLAEILSTRARARHRVVSIEIRREIAASPREMFSSLGGGKARE